MKTSYFLSLIIFISFLAVFGVLIFLTIDKESKDDQKKVDDQICGIESCHGLDIKCGSNVPEVCDMMYMLGDNCRQYATCEIVDGECTFIESLKFDTCKSCVENCQNLNPEGGIDVFECESKCIENN